MQSLEQVCAESVYLVQGGDCKQLPLPFESQAYKVREAQVAAKAVGNDRMIDMGFLSMTSKDGFPRFAVFSATESRGVCQLSLKVFFRGSDDFAVFDASVDGNPVGKYRALWTAYEPAYRRLVKEAIAQTIRRGGETVTVSMTSTFSGVVPDSVRSEIRGAVNSKKYDDVMIVAEADNWKIEGESYTRPRNPDPLVIGVKGMNCFLITTFDTTPVEDYVIREFSSSATTQTQDQP